jgi:lipopolysaccharide/colanic/teichoic acid biosynthesis glycosyltransferase
MSVLSLPRLSRTPLSLGLKRAIDITGAAIGLVLLSPLLLLIAVAIKRDSPGPVIFSQVRIGRGNEAFRILKFRTMVQGAEGLKAEIAHLNEVEYPLLKIPDDQDPRLTRVGRLLRRTMLDELPQLWNVLRGEMSLVGPRPLEPHDDAEVIGWNRTRLELTPGLTGPWQAMGRHSIPFREMVTLDCLYVADWSPWNDVKLMIRTVQVMLHSDRS